MGICETLFTLPRLEDRGGGRKKALMKKEN